MYSGKVRDDWGTIPAQTLSQELVVADRLNQYLNQHDIIIIRPRNPFSAVDFIAQDIITKRIILRVDLETKPNVRFPLNGSPEKEWPHGVRILLRKVRKMENRDVILLRDCEDRDTRYIWICVGATRKRTFQTDGKIENMFLCIPHKDACLQYGLAELAEYIVAVRDGR